MSGQRVSLCWVSAFPYFGSMRGLGGMCSHVTVFDGKTAFQEFNSVKVWSRWEDLMEMYLYKEISLLMCDLYRE